MGEQKERAMQTLLVCLDGTDQVKTQGKPKSPTNIARLFDAIGGKEIDADYGSYETANQGVRGKYLPGVGTQEAGNLKILGDLFGDGLPELIVRGYTYLSRQWQPQDRIVISGFSRGATAARALAGLVTDLGLLDPTKYDPGDKESAYERAIEAWYMHRKGVLAADAIRRDELERKLAEHGRSLPKLASSDFVPVPRIEAVAVFDTVSSLGMPHLGLQGVRFDFEIIDTALSPKIKFGFHALAADETRDVFSPTFWDRRDGVQQVVFPGCHSNVGGGFADIGLSDVALSWMIDRLSDVDVRLDRTLIKPAIEGRMMGSSKMTPRVGHCSVASRAGQGSSHWTLKLTSRWCNGSS